MTDKQELMHLTFREKNGQIGYMSKGISLPEFCDLIQPKQQNINVLIDFYPIIDTLYSLHTQKQNDEIYVKFNSLYSYWNDTKAYKDKQIILSSFQQLKLSSNELLNILKIKLETYNRYDSQNYINNHHLSTYDKIKKVEELINYSDMYIETILCFIHSKASLEIESFQQDKVLSDYVKYLKQIISKLYLETIGNRQNNKPYDYDFFQYLALEKSNELENFLKLHGEEYNISDFQRYLFNKLKLYSYYENNYMRYNASLDYKHYDNNEINTAILFRDTLFKIKSIGRLLEKLKKGDIEWSSDNNDIKGLKSYLKRDKQ